MLQVMARRYVSRPEYRVFEQSVTVNGFDTLTPKAARAALEIAFGNANGGVVVDHLTGYGYRVYAKSARKFELSGDETAELIVGVSRPNKPVSPNAETAALLAQVKALNFD